MKPHSLAFAAHLLAQFDGATVISREGQVTTTKVHLVPSKKAEELIKSFPGTRHTSACRLSYDRPDVLIITVSADGPVTIFSDGMSIFELRWASADKVAESIRNMMGKSALDAVWTDEFEAVCPKCGKTSQVGVVTVAGYRGPEEATCPVCDEVVAERRCYDMQTNLRKIF